jgi:hypothetical protein
MVGVAVFVEWAGVLVAVGDAAVFVGLGVLGLIAVGVGVLVGVGGTGPIR